MNALLKACRAGLLLCCGVAISGQAQEQKKPPELPPGPKVTPAPAEKPLPKLPVILFPPNEIDLKAAYCRPVVAATLSDQEKILATNLPPELQQAAKERHASAMNRTRRLAFYLLPRLNTLESTGLLDAQSRGYNDVASLVELARTCDAKCGGMADIDASAACRQRCSNDSEAAKRARDCDDLSWLPLKDF